MSRLAQPTSSASMDNASHAMLSAMDVSTLAQTVSTALLDTTNVDLCVSRPATPINSLIVAATLAFLAIPTARPALVNSSAPLVPTLKQSQSMVSVMIAHILARPAAQLLLSARPALLASTLSAKLALLLAQPAQLQSMVFVSATVDTSTPTNASPLALLATVQLADNALNALPTALDAQAHPMLAPAVSADTHSMLSLDHAKSHQLANSDSTSLNPLMLAQGSALRTPSTTSLCA